MKINGSEIGGSYYHDVLTLTCEGKQLKATTLEIWEWLAQKAAQQSVQLTGLRRCPACKSLLEEHSVYCDVCGTDTPRN